jgi:thymidylate kinase
VLAEVHRSLGDGVVLLRGFELSGSDVDLVVLAEAAIELPRLLARSGLEPRPDGAGGTLWVDPGAKDAVRIDPMPASAWPDRYPPLAGALSRLERGEGLPPVFSAEDRLLMLAADAVLGRPLEKVVPKVRALIGVPGARERLDALAASLGEPALARLVGDPAGLSAAARRGRLPYGRAAAVALRSRAGRAALRTRAAGRLGASGAPARWGASGAPAPRARGPLRARGLLIALSGMDGAGKSTVAHALAGRLEAAGAPATTAWGRLAGETRTLDRIATPVKRVLRPRGTVADPLAAGERARPPEAASARPEGGSDETADAERVAEHARTAAAGGLARTDAAGERGEAAPQTRARGGASARAWVVVVAAVNARTFRRTARARRGGRAVVCDRWATDSLVDLRLRYGRHRLAERLLRLAAPRPDLALLLRLDADTATRRKPGDQDERVLADMERLYEDVARDREAAGDRRFVAIDARRPLDEVIEAAWAEVERVRLP